MKMSLTTQNSLGSTSTAAADLRERRRKRILQNAEGRLSKILSGPSGGEKRQAPTIEGMYGKEGDDQFGEGEALANCERNVPSDFFVQTDSVQHGRDFVHECFERHRWLITSLVGVVLRLLVQFDLVRFVALTFVVLFASYQLLLHLRFPNDAMPCSSDGIIFNCLLVCGLNERFVRLAALTLHILWQFITDFCCMAFAFLVTHWLFILSKSLHPHIVSLL